MKRGVAVLALFLSFVLPLSAQDAFTPLIYAEEVAQTMKMIQQIQNQLQRGLLCLSEPAEPGSIAQQPENVQL